jgi:hypothetical protein
MRTLVESAGFNFALPLAGCSEVVATRIADAGPFRELAVTCLRTPGDIAGCGTCLSCFRVRNLRNGDAPEPDEYTTRLLNTDPVPNAISVVYAAQRAAVRHPALEDYADVNLSFLERYFPNAVDAMVPNDLRERVHARLAALGIEPMSPNDELRLRTIGQTFAPAEFSFARAGIAEA